MAHPIDQILAQNIKPEECARVLDDVLYEYSYQLALDADEGHHTQATNQAATHLWLLRELRNAFYAIAGIRIAEP